MAPVKKTHVIPNEYCNSTKQSNILEYAIQAINEGITVIFKDQEFNDSLELQNILTAYCEYSKTLENLPDLYKDKFFTILRDELKIH